MRACTPTHTHTHTHTGRRWRSVAVVSSRRRSQVFHQRRALRLMCIVQYVWTTQRNRLLRMRICTRHSPYYYRLRGTGGVEGGLFYAMCPLSLTSTSLSLSLSLFGGSREFDYPPPTTRFCISIYICDVHLRTCVNSRRPAQTHPAGPSGAQIAAHGGRWRPVRMGAHRVE